MDESSPARNKKRTARPRTRAKSREPLAIVEVPPDPHTFKKALLLLQPIWVRMGGHVIIWCAAFGVLWMWPPSPDTPNVVLRIMIGIPAALASACYMGLRHVALRRQVDRWLRHASPTGCDRIELNEDGLIRGGTSIPWSDVSDAAEIDYVEATLLAVRARGSWIILPASCFTRGDFSSARSLLMRNIGDKLRIPVV